MARFTEDEVCRMLAKLADRWPSGYTLFGNNHLVLVRSDPESASDYGGDVVAVFAIPATGGDPD